MHSPLHPPIPARAAERFFWGGLRGAGQARFLTWEMSPTACFQCENARAHSNPERGVVVCVFAWETVRTVT